MFGESGRENKKEKSSDYKVDMDNRKFNFFGSIWDMLM